MKRRGIGNVIATVIMVFLIVLTISQLYVYNIDQIDSYNAVAEQVFNQNAQRQNERISIANVVLVQNLGTTWKVTLTISNVGSVNSNIVEVWLDDADLSASLHQRIVENAFIGPGLGITLNNLDTGISNTVSHRIVVKAYTALGNSASVTVLPPGLAGTSGGTQATTLLTLDPQNPITSNNINVILTVSNNNQLGVGFASLTPDLCAVEGKIAPITSTIFSGNVGTGSTSTTLADSGSPVPNWGTDVWANYVLVITAGLGAGQVRLIQSNSAANPWTLTLSSTSPWATIPDSTSRYAIVSNCHANSAPVDFGTVSTPFQSTTLSDTSKSWSTGQWANYAVTIVAGTGAGQRRTISSSTGSGGSPPDQLTLSSSWSTTPDSSSKYVISAILCNAVTGTSVASPVSCTPVPCPSSPCGPAANVKSLSFLPFGSSVTFQWSYTVASIVADSPITFSASYVNMSTTYGLLPSQIQANFATVRGAGGAAGTSGGNFQNAFGSLVNLFLSFQVTQDGTHWSSGSTVARSTNTIFRVNVTNLSSKTIAFNSSSVIYMLPLAVSGGRGQNLVQQTPFFIMAPCPNSLSGGVPVADSQPFFHGNTYALNCFTYMSSLAYPSSVTQRLMVGPSQTIALYFGAQTQGGTAATTSPNTGSYLIIVSLAGSTFQGQNAPVSQIQNCVGGSCSLSVGLSPAETGTYTIPTPQVSAGITASAATGITSTGFTIPLGSSLPSSCLGGCTVTWGVYCVSPCVPTATDHSPYSQAAPFFIVNTQ